MASLIFGQFFGFTVFWFITIFEQAAVFVIEQVFSGAVTGDRAVLVELIGGVSFCYIVCFRTFPVADIIKVIGKTEE